MPCYDELNKQIKGLQSRITQTEKDLIANYVGISQLVTSLQANPFTSASVAASSFIYNFSPVGMKLLRELLEAILPPELIKTIHMLTLLKASTIDDLAEGIVTGVAASVLGMVNNGIDAVTQEALTELNAIQNELYSLDPRNILKQGAESIINTLEINGNNRMIYQKTLMDEAHAAWNDALIAANGEINDGIKLLRTAYLEQAKVYYQMKAGIAGAFATVNNVIGEGLKPINEINADLKQVNAILGFLTTQDDITNCKSHGMKLGG